jgi:hypothetical protein
MDSSDLAAPTMVAPSAQPQAAVQREARHSVSANADRAWQKKLLPLMAGMLVAFAAFFFVASFLQLYYLLDLGPAMASLDEIGKDLRSGELRDPGAASSRLEFARWKTFSLLEANALGQRYHQAGVLLISRIWTRYLGFVTGTILALVGAAFILGKLTESPTSLGAESAGWKLSISSASPGLILAGLGTLLMLATLATNLDMQVTDGPVYLSPRQAALEEPPPLLTPDAKAQKPRSDSDILTDIKREALKK